MDQNTYILVGICIFCLLIGNRLKNYFKGKKEDAQQPLKKNQRSKAAKVEYPSGRYRNRDKVKRIFTYIVIGVLFILVMVLVSEIVNELLILGKKMTTNLFMCIVIVIAASFTIVSSYMKVRKKKKD
jgi:Na+/proline symporter